jgi:hypothetical protein
MKNEFFPEPTERDGEKYQMLLENVQIFLTLLEQWMGNIKELPNFLAAVQ